MDENNKSNMAGCGIIILGNSGAGKSFVANKILDQERFKHGISAKSITHSTDFEAMTLDGKSIVVFNIPGLIEADQKRIILNKKEIETAFEKQPNSIVMFIFGNQNGRPVNQDIVAFNAIHKAYSFKQNSLLLAVNKVPRDGRPSDYKGEILTIFQEQIEGMVIDKENLLILDEITDIENSVETGRFREEIMQVSLQVTHKNYFAPMNLVLLLNRP
jgi:signal recognition particle receptor subunit beta